jgi:FSR family fosmidomycin resistance protein-like MFS transporter
MAGKVSGSQLGRGMSYWMVGGELGRTLGPVIAVGAVSWLTLPGLPYTMLMGWAASFIIFFRLRAIPVTPNQTQTSLHWRAALLALKPVLLPLIGLMIARSMLELSISIYLPVYLTQKGASLWLAGASLTIYEAAGLLGALLGGLLSDRLGRKKVILFSIVTAPLLTAAFLLAPAALRLPLLLMMGFSILCVNPVVMALVQENTPQNRALALGVFLGINFVIGSIASVAAGMLGDAFGLTTAFAGSAALYLLGAPLVLLLPRASKP